VSDTNESAPDVSGSNDSAKSTREYAAETVVADMSSRIPLTRNIFGDIVQNDPNRSVSNTDAVVLNELDARNAAESRGLDYDDLRSTIKQHHAAWDFLSAANKYETVLDADENSSFDQIIDAIVKRRDSNR